MCLGRIVSMHFAKLYFILQEFYCDGDNDCGDSSDEPNDCTPILPSSPCKASEFHCSKDICIPMELTCDGDDDCTNGEDELDSLCRKYYL